MVINGINDEVAVVGGGGKGVSAPRRLKFCAE
jgi:hypothetical protein